MKPQTKRLIELFDKQPIAEFIDNGYVVYHKPSGIVIWIANGWSFVEAYEQTKFGFNCIEKWRVWRAYKRLRGRTLVDRMNLRNQ